MVSATLNQDMKELATMTLKEALTFTVQQQQRKADLHNIHLAQYLVRLKFDDVEERAPRVSRKERMAEEAKNKKKTRKRRDYMDPEFDSEEEYDSEIDQEQQDDGSDVEYDDGKMSDAGAGSSNAEELDDVVEEDDEEDKMSDEGDLLGSEEESDSELDQESSGSELEEPKKATKAAKVPAKKAGDDYEFEKEEGEDEEPKEKKDKANKPKGNSQKVVKTEAVQPAYIDRYRMDPLLVRRESTLLLLCLKAFKKRVIVFFNEKKQCGRLHSLFAFFGLKSVEVHGDLSQDERLANVEKFQRGDADFLLATDLVARGLDISAVKAVLNFSFPTEPKRYLHRVGRTARAGSHGQAVTLCNDEERKEIKKLIRKLGQKLLPYAIPSKLIKIAHDYITNTLDPVIREVQLEQLQDKEIEQAYKEAQRAENLVKYKDEIMSRPKTEWHKNYKEKKELQTESKKDLKNIGDRFDESLGVTSKKVKERERKIKQKEAEKLMKANKDSAFGQDKEARKKGTGEDTTNYKQGGNEPEPKSKIQLAKEDRKFRGKRNSIGAKMAQFRGGSHDFKRSGGGIGDRDLSGKSKSMSHARGGFAPERDENAPTEHSKGKGKGKAGNGKGAKGKKGGNKGGKGGSKGGKPSAGQKRGRGKK